MPSPSPSPAAEPPTVGSEIIVKNESFQAIQVGQVFVAGKVEINDRGSQFRLSGLFDGDALVGGRITFDGRSPDDVGRHVVRHIARRIMDGHLATFGSTVPAGTQDTLAALRKMDEPPRLDAVVRARESL